MERVFGKPATEAGLAPWQQRRLAETMVSALLAAPFFSATEQAVFHGDLHGGNLFAADDGRLAVLDWGLTTGVSKAQRELLVGMALGALSLDAAALRRALASLVGFEPDEPLVTATVERALDRLVAQDIERGLRGDGMRRDRHAARASYGMDHGHYIRKEVLSDGSPPDRCPLYP